VGELAGAGLVAGGTAVEVCAIILGGLWLDELLRRSGARDTLSDWLAGVTADPGRRVLLVVLGVVPFVESVTGFGVGAIVGLPLLRRLGFDARRAAALSLLGFVAVPWGALGPGTLVAARLTGLSFDELGVASAQRTLPVFAVCGLAALVIGTGAKGALRRLGALAVVACSLWLGILGANLLIGTALAGVAGSIIAVGALMLLARRAEGRLPRAGADVRRAAGPYALLVLLLLAGQGAAVLTARAGAGAPTLVLGSAATWLLLTCALLARRDGAEDEPGPLRAVLPRWAPFALTTAAFLALGALMNASGMAAGLAGAGAALGPAYQGVASWLGGLGGFLTGSNAGGNALFASAQAEAAKRIGVSVLELVAFQNLGASLGTMGSAARVQLAQSLLEPGEQDPAIARQVLGVCAAAMAGLSLLALVTAGNG
jgi:lactate permease